MTAGPRILRLVTLLATAMVFGLTLTHVLQSPGSRGLDGPTWLAVMHTFYGGFAIVGGAAEVVGLVTSLIETGFARRWRERAAPAIVAVCLAGTLVSYWFGNRPVNDQVARWTPATLPPDWSTYRDQWEAAHSDSAVLSGIALLALLIATVRSPGRIHEPGLSAQAHR
jgi:hypothetical protein